MIYFVGVIDIFFVSILVKNSCTVLRNLTKNLNCINF